MDFYFECIGCGLKIETENSLYVCPKCGDLLDIKYHLDQINVNRRVWNSRPISVWRYRELLPIDVRRKIISLQEGGTRFYRCDRLEKQFGLLRTYVKYEGDNPTGSFKDRGMTVAVSKAFQEGVRVVVCASTGNTSASLTAYAAKAGIKPVVVVPSSKIATGKMAQAAIHGAMIFEIRGNFDDALRIVKTFAERNENVRLLNSINPFRIEGQKTLSMEIIDQLRTTPDVIILPVGNAGNISAVWKGLKELNILGLIKEVPRLIGVQAQGAAPIAEAYKKGALKIDSIQNPETIATAIRIGRPASWKKALKAVKDSRGCILTVSDKEILEGQKLIARIEGLFVEPASATTIAVIPKLIENRLLDNSEKVVCVATGHGLKDPEIAISAMRPPKKIGVEVSELEESIKEL